MRLRPGWFGRQLAQAGSALDLVGHIQKGAVATPNQEWMHQRGTLAEALEAVDQKFSRQGPGWFGLGCFPPQEQTGSALAAYFPPRAQAGSALAACPPRA